jgi:hypothetical protein
MLTSKSKTGRHGIRKRRRRQDAVPVRPSLRDFPLSETRRTGVLGFIAGAALGCLFGLVATMIPNSTPEGNDGVVGINPRTGHPQLHVKGQPEIPDVK